MKFIITFCIGYDKGAHFLIKKGADVNIVGKYGNTALMLAASKGTERQNFFVLKSHRLVTDCTTYHLYNFIFSDLFYYLGKEKIVRELLDEGAEKNTVNNDGLSALLLAAKNGKTLFYKIQIKSFQILIKYTLLFSILINRIRKSCSNFYWKWCKC